MAKGSPRTGSGTSKKPDAELREPKKESVGLNPKPMTRSVPVKRHPGQGGRR